eukprot:15449800-Alexandrium_andersonii.AAC.1
MRRVPWPRPAVAKWKLSLPRNRNGGPLAGCCGRRDPLVGAVGAGNHGGRGGPQSPWPRWGRGSRLRCSGVAARKWRGQARCGA